MKTNTLEFKEAASGIMMYSKSPALKPFLSLEEFADSLGLNVPEFISNVLSVPSLKEQIITDPENDGTLPYFFHHLFPLIYLSDIIFMVDISEIPSDKKALYDDYRQIAFIHNKDRFCQDLIDYQQIVLFRNSISTEIKTLENKLSESKEYLELKELRKELRKTNLMLKKSFILKNEK